MSTSDGDRSAAREINNGEDCRSDRREDDDDERLRSRLGEFTIGDEMGDTSASANHRYAYINDLSLVLQYSVIYLTQLKWLNNSVPL